jgi:hypothetical protein
MTNPKDLKLKTDMPTNKTNLAEIEYALSGVVSEHSSANVDSITSTSAPVTLLTSLRIRN